MLTPIHMSRMPPARLAQHRVLMVLGHGGRFWGEVLQSHMASGDLCIWLLTGASAPCANGVSTSTRNQFMFNSISSSGSLGQFTLTQPASQSVSLDGVTAQLSCTISTTFGGFAWYQQQEARSPKFLLWYTVSSGKTDFGSEVSGHFSASIDDTRKIAYLTISNVLAKDEATYYCAASHGSGSSYG
uniref:Uncharacterized protein n=1 Tax=Sphaerodactylus townsendi TaxID=933632 RepID=A0ACB8FYW4_9SAUR